MSLTKNQLIIAGATGLVVVVAVLIFTGIIPGLRTSGPESIAARLTIWSVGDPEEAFTAAYAAFNAKYPNVTFSHRSFSDEAAYETVLLDSLAAGVGPDIFAIRNDKVLRHLNKLAPSVNTIALPELRSLFPQVVEKDFYVKNGTYALPLSIDTLALFYNRDLLDDAGVPNPPATWNEVQTLAPQLTKKSAEGAVTQSGIALGGRADEIPSAVDALYLLMLQTGTKMTDDAFTRATFDSPEGLNALRFYLQFGNPSSASYAWASAQGNARDRFADEKLAILVDYASAIPSLTTRNAFLNYAIAPIPQPKDAAVSLAYPSYYGFGVSLRAANRPLAWEFVKTMATSEPVARAYVAATGRPPALRSLANAYESDLAMRVFSRQILTARSWPQADPDRIRASFSTLITSALSDPTRAADALRTAAQEVTAIIGQRF